MIKQEIIEKITKYFKLTHFEAEKIYDDIFQSIIKGVKDDNITEISNLGEFILKYNENENSGFKKTVEFLSSSNLQEEISGVQEIKEDEIFEVKNEVVNQEIEPVLIKEQKVPHKIEEQKTIEKVPYNTEGQKPEKIIPGKIEEPVPEFKTPDFKIPEFKTPDIKIPEIKTPEFKTPEIKTPEIKEEQHIQSSLSIEDEIKRKRDEIIHKLDPEHHEKYHPLLHVSEGINLNVPKPIVIKGREFSAKEETPEIKEEIKEAKEEIKAEVKDDITKEKEVVEELTTKSFSDYFTEVKEDQKTYKESPYKPPEEKVIPPAEAIIPPVAVELHNEIMGGQTIKQPPAFQTAETSAPLAAQNSNGFSTDIESKINDNSYYIWYKDSEPNAIDTQTMSYEYELLYQATKEAEYKSRLRIYVTTFILFFSVVLILLIFSPVFYKYFFKPADEQSNEQTVPEEQSTKTSDNNTAVLTPPQQNTSSTDENLTNKPNEQQQNTQTPPENETNTQPVTSEGQNSKNDAQSIKQQNTSTTPNVEGLVKTDNGWRDEKNNVIYVQLENGKFSIQESSWDSNDKANKRISIVASYNISGLNGSVIKTDLGAKGTWYRARFGDFTTLEEAKQKAGELRNKDKNKPQVFLLSNFLFA